MQTDVAQPTRFATLHKLDVAESAGSQGSVTSTISSTFSAPTLPSTSSNLSSDYNVASPSKPHDLSSHSKSVQEPMPASPNTIQGQTARVDAPQIDAAGAKAPQTDNTTATPMSIVSHTLQGSKRTADGLVKGNGSSTSPTERPFAHKRNKSMDTHSSTRIGELSAQLKTRLSYAMIKVQNGWEKQSLDELEEVHSQRGSPNSAPGGSRVAFDSPSIADYRRRPSAVSDMSDHMMISPVSDSKRSHVNPTYWRSTNKPAMSAAANLISITGGNTGLGLAPAPNFETGRRRRSSITLPPPSLLGSIQRKHNSDPGAGSRAPTPPRAGILRMPSQQAEKDAVDTLLFMSSPKNSQYFPHTTQAGQNLLREGAPQRRVMFEAYPPQDRRMVYQPPLSTSSHYSAGPYAPQPAR